MLAFSTCWNNSRHTDGEEMIDEILELGFDTLELSHGMTVAKLPGIKKAFAANNCHIQSLMIDIAFVATEVK